MVQPLRPLKLKMEGPASCGLYNTIISGGPYEYNSVFSSTSISKGLTATCGVFSPASFKKPEVRPRLEHLPTAFAEGRLVDPLIVYDESFEFKSTFSSSGDGETR